MKKSKKLNYFYAVGRRRSSSSRVRLYKGEGDNMVNDVLVGKYFPGDRLRAVWRKPFILTGTENKYYFTAKVAGGGSNGQLEAVVFAISRALIKADKDFRLVLKKEGLLRRDPREKERRKVGTGGKARRAKQSPKR